MLHKASNSSEIIRKKQPLKPFKVEWNALIVWSLRGSGVEAIKSLTKGRLIFLSLHVCPQLYWWNWHFLLMWFFDILREEKNWHVSLGSLEKVFDTIQGNVQMVAWWHYHARVKLILWKLLHLGNTIQKWIFVEAGTVIIIN